MKKSLLALTIVAAWISVPFALGAAAGDRGTRAFAKADKDGDGKISKEEFSSATKGDKSKAEKAFARRDKNGDGFLSKEEFTPATTDAGKKDGDAKGTEKKRKRDK